MRSWRTAVLVGAALAAAGGCASVLGDFDVSAASGNDAGADGPVADAPTGDDGASDAVADAPDAADYLLKCDFAFAKPVVVDSLDDQSGVLRSFPRGGLTVVPIDDRRVRIVQDRTEGGPYNIYSIDTTSPQYNGKYVGQIGYREVQVLRLSGAVGIFGEHYQQIGGGPEVLFLPDQGYLPGNAPTSSFPLVGPNDIGGQAQLLEFTPGSDYFYAWTQSLNDGGTLTYVGRTTGDAGHYGQVAYDTPHGGAPNALHVGSNVHVFVSGPPPQGAVMYTVTDDADAGDGGQIGRKLSGPVPGLVLAVGRSPLPNRSNFAFIEVDQNSTTALGTWRVGSIDDARLGTFKVPDLPAGPIVNDTAEFPFDRGMSTWAGDEFAMIGIGSPSKFPGLNFLAMDAAGHVRARYLGAGALLSNDTNTIGNSAIALSQRIGVRSVSWDVAWTETWKSTDGGADYDVLLLDMLVCH